MAEDHKQFLLTVRGQDPLDAHAPLYSNFVAIARLGTDIQLEFIFVDINQLALLTEAAKKGSIGNEPQQVIGKTVSKVVMPGHNFLQLKDHLNTLFSALTEELHNQEVRNVLSPDAR